MFLIQLLKAPGVGESLTSQEWSVMGKICLTSARPQTSFVSANALKSEDFRRQQYGPLTNIINIASAGPRAQDVLAAIWSL